MHRHNDKQTSLDYLTLKGLTPCLKENSKEAIQLPQLILRLQEENKNLISFTNTKKSTSCLKEDSKEATQLPQLMLRLQRKNKIFLPKSKIERAVRKRQPFFVCKKLIRIRRRLKALNTMNKKSPQDVKHLTDFTFV